MRWRFDLGLRERRRGCNARQVITLPPRVRGRSEVVRFGELIVILELRQHGMSVPAIARRTGLSRGTIRKHITRGIEPPAYGPRAPRPSLLAPYEP
jgi:hypothetical protein